MMPNKLTDIMVCKIVSMLFLQIFWKFSKIFRDFCEVSWEHWSDSYYWERVATPDFLLLTLAVSKYLSTISGQQVFRIFYLQLLPDSTASSSHSASAGCSCQVLQCISYNSGFCRQLSRRRLHTENGVALVRTTGVVPSTIQASYLWHSRGLYPGKSIRDKMWTSMTKTADWHCKAQSVCMKKRFPQVDIPTTGQTGMGV